MAKQPEIMDVKKIPEYQNGAEGFIKFVEENVKFGVPKPNSPIQKWVYPTQLPTEPHPKTGKSFAEMWEKQKEIFREALKMRDGNFIYKLIVLCYPRGDGKSFLVCLIQIWKFFCFPRQLIVLGALSKDQTRFVHYDIIQSIILNSPKLLNVVGKQNLQHGLIQLKNPKGEVVSSIRPISSYSGIVSNITGYTFSEMFDLKDPKFFVQLDGSTRNIVNSLGTIDSTVSTKDHILYQLYKSWLSGADRLIYFSYRSAPNADPSEYWHPNMDKDQLRSYSYRFPPADFDRYFRNTWEISAGKLFSEPIVDSIFHIGYRDKNKVKLDDGTVAETFNEMQEVIAKADSRDGRKNKQATRRKRTLKEKQKESIQNKLETLQSKLVPTTEYYKLSHLNLPRIASNKELNKMGEVYDTYWSIHAGLDRADPMAKKPLARTIVTVVAKGLRGSKQAGRIVYEDRGVPEYIYLLLSLSHIEDSSIEGIKATIKECYDEYDGVDTLCSERYGAWDLATWCEELGIEMELVFPSYNIQKAMFTGLYTPIKTGNFKSPQIVVPGTKENNILREELVMFDYFAQGKWYGSPEKNEMGGVQDDSVYSLGCCLYGGKEYGIDDFRERSRSFDFGTMIEGNTTFIKKDIKKQQMRGL